MYDNALTIANDLKFILERGEEPIKTAAQHWLDIEAWEIFIEQYGPRSLLELGTGTGAFSKWLNPQFEWFQTIDDYSWHKKNNIPLNIVGLDFDIFLCPHRVIELIVTAPPRLVLFCDNGDKKKEVKEFSPYLLKGEYLAVHDYGTEIMKEDIPDNFELLINKGLTAIWRKYR